MAMRDFTMGAAIPTTMFDPALTFEIIVVLWLGYGMLVATISLVSRPSARRNHSTSTIIAAWCVLSVISPAIMLWRIVRPRE